MQCVYLPKSADSWRLARLYASFMFFQRPMSDSCQENFVEPLRACAKTEGVRPRRGAQASCKQALSSEGVVGITARRTGESVSSPMQLVFNLFSTDTGLLGVLPRVFLPAPRLSIRIRFLGVKEGMTPPSSTADNNSEAIPKSVTPRCWYQSTPTTSSVASTLLQILVPRSLHTTA